MLRGKVATITGGASGIGLATARLLAGKGAVVVIGDLDEGRLAEALSELRDAGCSVTGVRMDVTDPEGQRALIEAGMRHSGVLHIHVNNAGVVFPGPLDAIPDAEVERQVRVNLLGTIYGTREAARVMRRQGFGQIVNVASLAAISPLPGEAVYSATKFGVRGFTLSAAMELRGAGVHVAVVCPDSAQTPMLDFEASHGAPPLSFSGRILAAEEVAQAIVSAVVKRRREVCVPASRGWIAKIAGLAPALVEKLLPFIERSGLKELERRRRVRQAGPGP